MTIARSYLPAKWRAFLLSDLGILLLLALARILIQSLTNGKYGWHRDELAMLEDARVLDWGYVAYPPVAPFIARVGLTLFGPSLIGVRLFSVIAQAAAAVLTGLMVKHLGGPRWAQFMAALLVTTTPVSLALGNNYMYVTFDYLWWVLTAYSVIRLLQSEDPRWWLGIGAALGLGAMSKYTIAFLVAGLVVGVLLTGARRYLRSPWLWAGVGLALLIFLPNLIWQTKHNFVSLEFLSNIHDRDVRIGRSVSFYTDQLLFNGSPLTIALVLVGLYGCLIHPIGKRYRVLAWMYLVPLVLMAVSRGRGYYLTPAYPSLIAAGTAFFAQWLATLPPARAANLRGWADGFARYGALVSMVLVLRLTPIGSPLWNITASLNGEVKEEVGWPEMVKAVADVYQSMPDSERAGAGILAGNYGEAGAINLYGPAYGLPRAISGINSFWLRGYGEPPPAPVILWGFDSRYRGTFFTGCKLAGNIPNPYNVENEETTQHQEIYICQRPILPWPEFWQWNRYFG